MGKDFCRAHRAKEIGRREDDKSRYPSRSGFTHASVAVKKTISVYLLMNHSWETLRVCLQTACIARREAVWRFVRFLVAKHIITVTE